MPLTAAYLSNQFSPFFRVPVEVRHDIYHQLFPCSKFRYKEHADDASEPRAPFILTIAPLTTCYAIHEEATPFFYREARIHYSMSWRHPTRTIDMTTIWLPLLVHISIDFCCLGLRNEYGNDSKRMAEWCKSPEEDECPLREIERAVDRQVAECIDSISTHCSLLRSFTLHMLSSESEYDDEGEPQIFLQEALELADGRGRQPLTLGALKKLKVRDTIVVVAVAIDYVQANGYMYSKVREAIAPLNEWQVLALKEWPGISLTEEQDMEMEELKCFAADLPEPMFLDAEIYLWYYQPPGSKALLLPDHKIREENVGRGGRSVRHPMYENNGTSTDFWNPVEFS